MSAYKTDLQIMNVKPSHTILVNDFKIQLLKHMHMVLIIFKVTLKYILKKVLN